MSVTEFLKDLNTECEEVLIFNQCISGVTYDKYVLSKSKIIVSVNVK